MPRAAAVLNPRAVVAVLIAAGALAAAGPAEAGCRSADRLPSAGEMREARRATICLLNQERARHGLGRLRANADLRQAAQRHAVDMARRDYFSHVSRNGSSLLDRIIAAGFGTTAQASIVFGENLGWGAGSTGTPRTMVRMWMNSPSHRHNVLTARFRLVGVGIAAGAPRNVSGRAATYATNFGG